MAVDRKAVADALAQANAKTGLFGAKPAASKGGAMTEREWGYYWVRVDGYRPEISHWTGEWWVMRSEMPWPDPPGLVVLSPRLTLPDSADAPVPALTVRWNVPPGSGA